VEGSDCLPSPCNADGATCRGEFWPDPDNPNDPTPTPTVTPTPPAAQ
jgi:hypothetical protein